MENNIKIIRKRLKISQKQLGKHLKISQQAVSNIEKGESNVSPQKMIQICTFLGSDLNEVFPEMNIKAKNNLKDRS